MIGISKNPSRRIINVTFLSKRTRLKRAKIVVWWALIFFHLVSFFGKFEHTERTFWNRLTFNDWEASLVFNQSLLNTRVQQKKNAPSKRIPTKYLPVVWNLQKYVECLLCKYGRSGIFLQWYFQTVSILQRKDINIHQTEFQDF